MTAPDIDNDEIESPQGMALMPVSKLARLRAEAIDNVNWFMNVARWIDRALEIKYGEQLDKLRRQARKDTGIFRIKDDGVTAVVEMSRRYYWDQKKLAEIVERIRADGDDPEKYVTTQFRVRTHQYVSWPAHIQRLFDEARIAGSVKTVFRLRTK